MRKGERTAVCNERDYPHIVELPVPARGFGDVLHAISAFHDGRRVALRRGRGARRDDRDYARWCFADPGTAHAFAQAFGGVYMCRR